MPMISVPDDSYARLAHRPEALGNTVEALALPLLESGVAEPPSTIPDLPLEEWNKRFDKLNARIESRAPLLPADHMIDDSRESIYEGCGV